VARDVVGRLEQVPVVLLGDGGEVEQRPRALAAFEKSNIAMTNRGLPKAGVLSGTVRAAK
jgi:hypothetical protein